MENRKGALDNRPSLLYIRNMKNTATDLEMMARDMAAKTGATIDESRTMIRIEMARISVAMGVKTIDQANAYLEAAKVPARLRRAG